MLEKPVSQSAHTKSDSAIPAKSASPSLKELLKDPDVKDFFKMVSQTGLRIEAIEALDKRIAGPLQ